MSRSEELTRQNFYNGLVFIGLFRPLSRKAETLREMEVVVPVPP